MKFHPYLKDGTLCWTLTSNGYKYLTWNFVLHWRKAMPGQPICVICADKPSYNFMRQNGIGCVLASRLVADYGTEIVPFGTQNFSNLNRLKLDLLTTFAADPIVQTNMYIDGDIIVYGDLVSDLRTRLRDLSGASLWMPCDEQSTECSGTTCTPCTFLCTGLVAFRHGLDPALFRIHDLYKWAAIREDQIWVNRRMQELGTPYATLPRELYPNGVRVQKTHSDPTLKAAALCLHYNWRVGPAKRIDMKRYGDWLLPY